MSDSTHLALPYIAAAQAQKHVTHNEALRILDALVMLAVKDRDLSAPPGSPGDGDRYLVKPTGTGAFAGKDGLIAHYRDGAWAFYQPQAGWTCYVEDEDLLLVFDGAGWTPAIVEVDPDGTMAADSDAVVPSQKAVNTRINTLIASKPCFSANKNGTHQTGVPSATDTKVTFTTEEFDNGGYYDAANSKWVPPAGIARVTVGIAFTNANMVDGSGFRAEIWKNGVKFRESFSVTASTGAQGPAHCSCLIPVNGTDYIEAYARCDGAGDKTVSGNTIVSFFCGEMVVMT
jgi:hypothetical protein